MDQSPDDGKITLSRDDLRYVYNQLYISTMDRLNLHLPTEENDPMKNQVATILNEFLLNVFDDARHSLIVDGVADDKPISEVLALPERQEVVEPFDVELNQQLKDTLLEFENEIVKSTTQKRELPKQAAAEYEKFVDRVDQGVSEYLAKIDEEVEVINNQESFDFEIEDKDIPYEELRAKYLDTLEKLDELKQIVPETESRLERDLQTMAFLEQAYERQKREEL
ncbi:uncharacterized protein SPAPADRAFT_63557 [Spathaspora passalidarum NRRL Y-27907]|uniref:Uncharacterized protein n=1 Tax=Spathaspora passalidarum (strain NRRL Y-27907 / 11-Y1) TaxID=619300 RepID=G3AVI5_SPAPN|nr:uncharacterized protein SPAPADRAFT_63557 [Spathaspora passalidarum NRRL Y-27907]EGW29934.1 hypothetical protein SPAPADRAFT_63557 [Spathaspora passalidarum NRRL Y-27907]